MTTTPDVVLNNDMGLGSLGRALHLRHLAAAGLTYARATGWPTSTETLDDWGESARFLSRDQHEREVWAASAGEDADGWSVHVALSDGFVNVHAAAMDPAGLQAVLTDVLEFCPRREQKPEDPRVRPEGRGRRVQLVSTPRERIAEDINTEVGILLRELIPLVNAHRELTGENPKSFIQAMLHEIDVEARVLVEDGESAHDALARVTADLRAALPPEAPEDPEPAASSAGPEPEATPAPPLVAAADDQPPDPPPALGGDARFAHLTSEALLRQADESEENGMHRDARDMRAEVRRRGGIVPPEVPPLQPRTGDAREGRVAGGQIDREEARDKIRDFLASDGPATKSVLARVVGYRSMSAGAHRLLDGILQDLGAVEAGPYKGGMRYALPPSAEDLKDFIDHGVADDLDPPSGPSSEEASSTPAEGPSAPANLPSSEPGTEEGRPCVECGGRITLEDFGEGNSSATIVRGHRAGCVLDPARGAVAVDEEPTDDVDVDEAAAERYPPSSPEANARARAEGQTIAMEPEPQRNKGMGTQPDDNAAVKPSGAPPLSARVRREMEREAAAPAAAREGAPFPPAGEAREDHRRQAMADKIVGLIAKEPMTVVGIAANLFRPKTDVQLIVGHLIRVGWAATSRREDQPGTVFYDLTGEAREHLTKDTA